jgi:hypothetical protein
MNESNESSRNKPIADALQQTTTSSDNRGGRAIAAAASFPLPVRYFDRGHSRRSKENEIIIMESIKDGRKGRRGSNWFAGDVLMVDGRTWHCWCGIQTRYV